MPDELALKHFYTGQAHDLRLEEIEETLRLGALAKTLETVTIERARNDNLTHATDWRFRL